nr:unnamed protein product [Spirometra erinaceieuropaei]
MAHRPREMLSKVERDALRELQADKDLVIVPADKVRFTGVLDRTDYLQKSKGLLEDRQFYVPCAKNPLKTLTREINATFLALEDSSAIKPTNRRVARPQDTALARFYGPPKVRKDGAPLRTILSLKGTPTNGLVKWLFRRLEFRTAESDTTVSSSAEFLEKLKETKQDDVSAHEYVSTNVPSEEAIHYRKSLLTRWMKAMSSTSPTRGYWREQATRRGENCWRRGCRTPTLSTDTLICLRVVTRSAKQPGGAAHISAKYKRRHHAVGPLWARQHKPDLVTDVVTSSPPPPRHNDINVHTLLPSSSL